MIIGTVSASEFDEQANHVYGFLAVLLRYSFKAGSEYEKDFTIA